MMVSLGSRGTDLFRSSADPTPTAVARRLHVSQRLEAAARRRPAQAAGARSLHAAERELPREKLTHVADLRPRPRPDFFHTASAQQRRHARGIARRLPDDAGGQRRRKGGTEVRRHD